MSEFLVRDKTCEYWTNEITPEEFDRVIQIREGDSSIGYILKIVK